MSKTLKKLPASIIAAILLILLVTACTGGDKTPKKIELSTDSLKIGTYRQASVTVLNYDKSWKNFKVTSSDDYIAVDASTLEGSTAELPEVCVQAFGEGEATLTFSADGCESATLKIEVYPDY